MRFCFRRAWLAGGVALAAIASFAPVHAGDVISEISVRNRVIPGTFHDEVFVFPEDVRDYSPTRFYGWSFRQRLPNGATRVLEVARARTSGAYLLATDLFENGLFSTMSHSVLMIFPRTPRADLYSLSENSRGNLELRAPDGSMILVDGSSRAVLPTKTFSVAPIGAPGTPPGLRHLGLHLEIRAVGRSPFLRGTAVRVADAFGDRCELTTDELFLYGKKIESDVFRFDADPPFFRFLEARCPAIRLPQNGWQTASVDVVSATAPLPAAPVRSATAREHGRSWWHGGLFDWFSQLLSR